MLPRIRAHVARSPWRRRAMTLAATFIVAGGLTVLPASAASLTYTVCSDATYTTIAGAITAAAAAVGSTSDDVTITICADTYAESGLDLSGGGAIGILTLQTAGDGQVIVNETGSDKSDSIFEIGQAGGPLQEVKQRGAGSLGGALAPFTGDWVVSVPGEWDRDGRLVVRQRWPLPCTVLDLIAEVVPGT